MIIDNELLAAYAEGNVSQEEREAVRQYLAGNPDMMESVLFAMENTSYDNDDDTLGYDNYIENLGEMLDDIEGNIHKPLSINHKPSRILPATAMAAENKVDNLCVIRCEGIALRRFCFDITDEELVEESRNAGWLHQAGTALHNIGRLSGTRGLSVSHRYQCCLDDIRASLSANNIVIAAVDGNELTGDYAMEQDKDVELGMTPNHVIIVNIITEDRIIVTDSATPEQMNVYPLSQFLDAWEDSENFLTVISNGGEYTPHPIKLDDIEIEEELLELQEAIAENAHEVWAETRRNEGWTYGPFRDDEKRQNPDMIPYNLLPESEKEYDRLMAMNTIKLVKKLGWQLTKNDTLIRKAKRTHQERQRDYTDTELRAIATIILRLLCADTKIVSAEITARGIIYKRFGITYQHEQNLLPYTEALNIYKIMCAEKRQAVQQALKDLASADGSIHTTEQGFIEDLEKEL